MPESVDITSSPRNILARNCLLGGAIGDALGAPIEFYSLAEIKRWFGPKGLQDYAPSYGRLGSITDDTQMTLFTAEGLIRANVCASEFGMCDPAIMVHHAYLRWYVTQGPLHCLVSESLGFLFSQAELFSSRAPGVTCLSSLEATKELGQFSQNDSKGCGGVMRVAPIAFFGENLDHNTTVSCYELAVRCCSFTHGHPTGQHAGGAFAFILHRLLAGDSLQYAIDHCLAYLKNIPDAREVAVAIQVAKDAAKRGADPDVLESLGDGWIADEALAIGLYSSLCATSFADGILLAVNHSGDSDSTGSIAGNILGLLHGLEGIPSHWIADLELSTLISSLADDLVTDVSDLAPDKYPGC